MKVTANTAVRYNDVTYAAGEEFEITKKDYEQHKNILTAVAKEEKKDGGHGDTESPPADPAAGEK